MQHVKKLSHLSSSAYSPAEGPLSLSPRRPPRQGSPLPLTTRSGTSPGNGPAPGRSPGKPPALSGASRPVSRIRRGLLVCMSLLAGAVFVGGLQLLLENWALVPSGNQGAGFDEFRTFQHAPLERQQPVKQQGEWDTGKPEGEWLAVKQRTDWPAVRKRWWQWLRPGRRKPKRLPVPKPKAEALSASARAVILGVGFHPDGRFQHWRGSKAKMPPEAPTLPRRQHRFVLTDFLAEGARPGEDVKAVTEALERGVGAVAAVAHDGGGELVVPRGRWLAAPFNLTSHMTLMLADGAVLGASQDFSDWPVLPPLPSYGHGRDMHGPRYGSFIHGENLTDVVIAGSGVVDGQGVPWWRAFRAGRLRHTRGCLVELQWCEDVVVVGVHMRNAPFWHLHPYACNRVTVHNVTITAPPNSPNTDGVDPDSCTDVLVQSSSISVGDDAIAIKSGMDEPGIAYDLPSRNIVIQDLVVGHCHAISLGSEMSGGIANVLVQRIRMEGPCNRGLRIKSSTGRGGYITNVTFTNIVIHRAESAINVYSNYRREPGTRRSCFEPLISGIVFHNIKGTHVERAGRFEGLDDAPLQRIALRGVQFANVEHGYKCDLVDGTAHKVLPIPCPEMFNVSSSRPPRKLYRISQELIRPGSSQ